MRRGAGELLVTSMDRDGTREGYDLSLLSTISSSADVPLITSGGAGSVRHLKDAFIGGNADSVLVASILHFNEITILKIKEYLRTEGVPVRL